MLTSQAATGDLSGPRALSTITLVLGENMTLMRCALGRLLGAEPDLEVIAAQGCDPTLVDTVLRLRPDVVVVDVDEPVDKCLATVAELHRTAQLPIVALSQA